MVRLFAVAVVTIGCAHGEPRSATRVASAQPHARATPAELAPNESECDSLFLHAIDVIATPDVTSADKDATIAALHDEFVRGCLALSRSTYRCAAAAATVDDMLACDKHARSRR